MLVLINNDDRAVTILPNQEVQDVPDCVWIEVPDDTVVEEGDNYKGDGVFWNQNRLTQEEKAEGELAHLRRVRNRLLEETDIYALADMTMTPEMIEYRQALRDITEHYSSMYEEGFAFPVKPR